ncbi:polysaccharide biosynthesis protein [Lactobacillus sp. Sy-1]|uniref:putative polysaccharide biosynthesis protein n=1 Tax=Lactobacillus sp. Sy-1 TaxID=2109645 RepID=UPI001C5A0AE7|nr:polysaccharide biosynthesis protein [Lactobacillus sp. Sy-1]MBW1604779.1 polysaccharide biosynthesis protein [Lactobacillus sp. Sy-1]
MMKNNSQIQTVMSGAGILTLSSLIAKALSAAYRIPLQNLVGNIGFYIYQQVYPIYGIGMTFALSGLPVLISKLVAEEPDLEHRIGLVKRINVLLGITALLIFGGLQFGAPLIAWQMGDINLVPVIRAVSWMFLLMPFLSTSRGFFQGTLNMVPTAISQVVEQIVRISIIIMVAILAHRNHWDLYLMGRNAMLSSPIGALFSSLVLIVFCVPLFRRRGVRPQISNWQLTKKLFKEGGTICLLSALMIMMQLVDSFTIRKGLLVSGLDGLMSQDVKGVYDRAQPLVQVGLVIGTSFASAALPSLAKSIQDRQKTAFRSTAQLMVKSSLVITVLMTVGMMTLMPSINLILFGSTEGSLTLAVYCFSIVVVTLITTDNSILQGMGNFKVGFYAVVTSVIIKALITEALVGQIGILGGSISTVIALMGGLLVNEVGVRRLIRSNPYSIELLLKLTVATGLMVMVVILIQTGLMALLPPRPGRLLTLLMVILATTSGGVTAMIAVLKLKMFDDNELLSLPIVNRLVRIHKEGN